MATLHIVNPQASTLITPVSLADRVGDLSGKTVGLYWNLKAGGNVALEHTAYLLGQRFPGAEFKYYHGSVGASMRHATAEDAEQVARECDSVVGTTSD